MPGLHMTSDATRGDMTGEGNSRDFVSYATHQLRTPLSGVKWLLELAARDESVSEETRSYIADARDATERLIRLVNGMLSVSRLESGRLPLTRQPVALDGVTRTVLDEVAAIVGEKALRVTATGIEGVPSVTGDPHFVHQVVLNLVSNAVKYSAAGGTVRISLEAEGSTVTWSIQDEGVGIPRDAQTWIFEKFYRADNVLTLDTEGLGLGLCLSKLIVEQLGGQLWFESIEGQGSTFTFTLPLARLAP